MSSENPFASPQHFDDKEEKFSGAHVVDFVPILTRWERLRLRLYYNGILVVLVLLLTFTIIPNPFVDLDYWAGLIVYGIISNLCYFSGPLMEGYGRYFRIWNDTFTIFLFLAGLVFTMLTAIAVWCNIVLNLMVSK